MVALVLFTKYCQFSPWAHARITYVPFKLDVTIGLVLAIKFEQKCHVAAEKKL